MDKFTRIKENLYYDERSAGGIVFREEGKKTLWLVINFAGYKKPDRSSDPYRGKIKKNVYKFPKGHLKSGEFLKQAGMREVEEEGKVKAEVVTKIGSKDYIIRDRGTGKKIVKKVTFFLMRYIGESRLLYFDRERVLGREWLEYDEAMEKLAYDSERVLLKIAATRLERMRKRLRQ